METNKDKSDWATGGGLLGGLGLGFFFLKESALMFTGSIILGLGVGLIMTAFIHHFSRK